MLVKRLQLHPFLTAVQPSPTRTLVSEDLGISIKIKKF